ncbi:vascular endothelial growth factor receptor 2-like isoform X2 [Chroicocephalus ridibundus]|uniref:vascular endothelial growth factor receptor 2-like isoform X2 n=1 Tax=Chroicocephalus ridibundus TaxID=1192867 RepID=UPI002FDE59DD
MPAWLPVAVAGYLLVVLQGSSAMVAVTERRVAAEGSSVLMHAPDIRNVNFTEWEYIRTPPTPPRNSSCSTTQITSLRPFTRLTKAGWCSTQENGSILLQRLREADSGVYKATVDLMQDKARTTLLEVIQPVPQPELQCSSKVAGSPIELVCVVPEGTVASISWKKDGHPLPPEKCYLLSEKDTVLQIRNGEKSDCGSYSCNVSNVISWKEASLDLTVTGLTPPLRHVRRLAVVTLMFVAFPTIGFVVLLWQLREQRFGTEALKQVTLFTHGLLCVSSLLLLAASIIWMQEEGLSAAFVLLGLFFFAAAIGTAQAAAAAVWRPAALIPFKSKAWHRVIRNSTTPTTLIVNLLFATLLLHNTQQLHERGCSEAVDLTASCVSAVVAILITLLLLFLWHHRNMQKEKTMKRQCTTQSTQARDTLVVEETRGQRQEGE